MMIELALLRTLSLKKGLSLNYISKEDKVSYMLKQLNELFGEGVILKGGTAINRIYLQKRGLGRFSEDIDLDFISKEPVSAKIDAIKSKMKQIVGFEIKQARLMHRTLRFDCVYTNELGHKDKIQIEFYMSHDELLAANKPKHELVQSFFIETNPTMFYTYSLDDLFARKLVALFRREEGKDIYDVFYCIDMDFDAGKTKKCTAELLKFYKIDLNIRQFYDELLKKLDSYEDDAFDIGKSTNHFIPKSLRPDWKILLSTLKMKIRKKLMAD